MTAQVLWALALLGASGLAALPLYRSRRAATAIASAGCALGCALGGTAAIRVLLGTPAAELSRPWADPVGRLVVGVDALSAVFLLPLFVLGGLAAVYGRAYLLGDGTNRPLAVPALFFNLLIASMALVLVARSTVLLLVAWELMTLSSFLLVTHDHEQAAVRRAGWVYLIAGHVGVAALIALFLVLGGAGGGSEFDLLRASLQGASQALAAVAFALAAVGFGIKAGFVPLHVWLPEAHAAAPSHVSAVMSGVLIKIGLYGFLRTLSFLSPAAWWGPVLVALGLGGALLGISLALYQRDLKRALAYSSIENMGLVLLGLGIGYWGAARGMPRVAALGFAGGLLHAWNHTLMKGLLFLSAGSVLHGAKSRDLERLGGLLSRMPATGTAMILGTTAIAGLPPLCGFTSEWLLYLGLIERGVGGGEGGLLALLAVGLLALVGGLAALAFVRLTGITLLGAPRSAEAARAHEAGPWMLGPIVTLALAVVAAALLPGPLLSLQAGAVDILAGPSSATTPVLASGALSKVVAADVALWIAIAVLGLALLHRIGRRAADDETWGCGYAAPTARMQYGGSSFAQLLTDLLPTALRARTIIEPPRALFPAPGRYVSDSTDPLTRGLYEPFFTRWGDRFARLRFLQHGLLHVYLLYILVVVLGALAWTALRDANGWFAG